MVEKTCNFNCVYIYADKTVNKMFDIDLFFLSIWLKKIIYSFYLVTRLSDIENLNIGII